MHNIVLLLFDFCCLVVQVHHVVRTPSFKLLTFYIYICCFTVVGGGLSYASRTL